MITRAEHLERYSDNPHVEHRRYYAQFVDDGIRALVRKSIGERRIRESTDDSFNDIPLHKWDLLVHSLTTETMRQLKECGDWLSLGTGVCILKEAAQQIREEK